MRSGRSLCGVTGEERAEGATLAELGRRANCRRRLAGINKTIPFKKAAPLDNNGTRVDFAGKPAATKHVDATTAADSSGEAATDDEAIRLQWYVEDHPGGFFHANGRGGKVAVQGVTGRNRNFALTDQGTRDPPLDARARTDDP